MWCIQHLYHRASGLTSPGPTNPTRLQDVPQCDERHSPCAEPNHLNRRDIMFGANDWFSWAVLSAIFAALTAIFAKLGLKGVDSDYATLLRTFVIAMALSLFVVATKRWRNPATLPWSTLTFLVLPGLATGASWVCYFRALKMGEASKVAPVDKLSLVLVMIFAVSILGERPSPREWLAMVLIGIGVLILGWKP